MAEANDWNSKIIEEFRANQSRSRWSSSTWRPADPGRAAPVPAWSSAGRGGRLL